MISYVKYCLRKWIVYTQHTFSKENWRSEINELTKVTMSLAGETEEM